MTGALRWHSCSTDDFPLKRHKVSKACEACRARKMRCDGKNPCQRCESNLIKCIYKDRPSRSSHNNNNSTSVKVTSTATHKPEEEEEAEKKQQQQPKELSASPITTTTSTRSTSSCSMSPQLQPQQILFSSVSSQAQQQQQQQQQALLKQQQEQVPIPSNITISNLNKITFLNDLYETLRSQQQTTTTARRYGTSIPPLFMDFFNTTSQPQTIWTYFIVCFNRFCDSQPSIIPTTVDKKNSKSQQPLPPPELESNELVKETCRVFITHNLLYGSFIDTSLLLFVLESVSMFSYMQTSSSSSTSTTTSPISATPLSATAVGTTDMDEFSLPYYSILIYSILAITFQSAYQSLPNMNENFTNSLYIYSHVFYREAHKRFLAICFPTIPPAAAPPSSPQQATTTKEKSSNKTTEKVKKKKSKKDQEQQQQQQKRVLLLMQASVLLTHFQCTAINEEQAFMTIKIGLGLAQQLDLSSQRRATSHDESTVILLKTLDAWYVWLAFYLKKPYSIDELDDMLNFPSSLEDLMRNQKEQQEEQQQGMVGGGKRATTAISSSSTREQRWALHVTDAYTCFLKSLLMLKKTKSQSISMMNIKKSLKILSNLNSMDNKEEFIPSNIISLYHDILTIQLYSCQFDQGLLASIHSSGNEHNTAAEQCILLCTQNILTTVNKVIFCEYNNTNATAPLKYVPLSIIYAICLLSQINIYLQKKDINLINMLKIASPYFEAFQILYSKFSLASPSSPPLSSLSTSSSTNTATTTSISMMTAGLTTAVGAGGVGAGAGEVFLPINSHFLSTPTTSHQNNGGHELILEYHQQQQQQQLNLPMTPTNNIIVRSRADIDREQLDKLSQNKHHYQSQLQQQQQQQQLMLQQKQLNHHHQQQQQFQFSQTPSSSSNNYYLQQQQQQLSTTTNKRGVQLQQQQHTQLGNEQEQYLYYSSGQKRSSLHQQQQLYNQLNNYNMQQQQSASKRHRSNTATSYEEFAVVDNSRSSRNSMTSVNGVGGFMDLVQESAATEPSAAVVTNQDAAFLWMLEGSGGTANSTSHDFYNSHNNGGGNATAEKQHQLKYPPSSQQLPLPQPTSMMMKNWFSAAPAPTQTNTKLFFDSEVQTLHYQTPPLIHFESAAAAAAMTAGLNVLNSHGGGGDTTATHGGGHGSTTSHSLMYPGSHRASIISDSGSSHRSGAMVSGTTRGRSSKEEEAAEAAAAAAAVAAAALWQSTVVQQQVAACGGATANGSTGTMGDHTNSGKFRSSASQAQQNGGGGGGGHWINTEKVGDDQDDYWPE